MISLRRDQASPGPAVMNPGLDPARKADLLYAQAHAELAQRLWQAALGADDGGGAMPDRTRGDGPGFALDQLLATLMPGTIPPAPPPAAGSVPPEYGAAARGFGGGGFGGGGAETARDEAIDADPDGRGGDRLDGLSGANAQYRPALLQASARTGLPAAAIAAIVNAEAAKNDDGSWRRYSRNPRSSAAGLGQFLSGTWEGMAERPGSWLHGVAHARGWLDAGGKVMAGARSDLLQLRYDATAAILTTADYARLNLDRLKQAGVAIGETTAAIAQAAYVGHHLGAGDAVRFMTQGLDPARARLLLDAQVGTAAAGQLVADAGNATAAHRSWFMNYVRRNLKPAAFAI